MSSLLKSACRDTLFLEDFKLADFVKEFLASRASSEDGALVPCYKCKDDGKIMKFKILLYNILLMTSLIPRPIPSFWYSMLATWEGAWLHVTDDA